MKYIQVDLDMWIGYALNISIEPVDNQCALSRKQPVLFYLENYKQIKESRGYQGYVTIVCLFIFIL